MQKKVQQLKKKNQMHKYGMGENWISSSTAEKDLQFLVDHKQNMGQQCDEIAKKEN